jgi:methylated-DNA-[protein]-cysteine S-methyltransferase
VRWTRELEEYFTRGPRSWTAGELGLDQLPVSPFAREVYRSLLQIPPGETVSYGELATLAGHPGAARAVGTAMAANPLALAIPCHRVVRADGSAGRYGSCDALKPYLLSLEGAF